MLLKLTTVSEVDADNPVEGDLYLSDGKLAWLGRSGFELAEYAQRLRSRLRFFKGEWFLDADEGVPYFDEILEKGIDDGRVATIIQRVILSTPGFVSLDSFSLEHDRARRAISINFQARVDGEHVLSSNDFGPFEIETGQLAGVINGL